MITPPDDFDNACDAFGDLDPSFFRDPHMPDTDHVPAEEAVETHDTLASEFAAKTPTEKFLELKRLLNLIPLSDIPALDTAFLSDLNASVGAFSMLIDLELYRRKNDF